MTNLVPIAMRYIGTNPRGWTFPWCAAFLNLVLSKAGEKGTSSLMARSFLKLGKSTKKPEPGDIAVFWRIKKQSAWGHAGLYIAEHKDQIIVLGGNQGGTVSFEAYPKRRLLDIRKLCD